MIARDSSNSLAGGIYGELYWGWLNILALWVSPDLRRQGLGSQLLSRAEAEALSRGCRGVYLDTFTFQNVALYTRAGYEMIRERLSISRAVIHVISSARGYMLPNNAFERAVGQGRVSRGNAVSRAAAQLGR